MAARGKLLIASVLLCSLLSAWVATLVGARRPSQHWLLCLFYLAAVLLTSGMKVCLLRNDSTMSVNFPFILLAVLQLSPLQAMALAAISVFAQCRFRVQKFFSLVQIGFNIANAVNATAACWLTYFVLRRTHLTASPALAVAAVAYFFVTTAPVAVIVAWTSDRKPLALWRDNFAWFLPFYLVGAALSSLAYFLGTHYGLFSALLLVPAAYTIYRAYNGQIARIRDSEQHIADMEALHLRTIESLAMAIEAKDQDTHDHLLRVRVYVTEIGKALNLAPDEMQAVKTAALLHDIGKLAVPERIINKPGKLTPEEFETMKIHPVVGAEILARVRFPYPVVPIVRAHHEWWNGMGYPDGLRGEAIPIGARILTAVDCFDAMASDRPYRRAMPIPEAMAIVRKMAGTQFDPRVIEVLERHCVKLEEQARLEGEKLLRLNTGFVVSRGLAPGAGFEQESAMGPMAGEACPAQPTADQEQHARRLPTPEHMFAAVAAQMQALLRLTGLPGGPLALEETLASLALRLSSHIPFRCLVLYRREAAELLPFRAGGDGAAFFSAARIALGEGISGWVAKHEHSIVNGNATVEPNYLHQSDHQQDLRSALSIPLRGLDGALFGVLSLYAAGANAFSRNHLRALEAVETTITLALQNSMRERQLELGDIEACPAGPLFATLDAAIAKCRANGETLTLLICDLAGDDERSAAESSPGSDRHGESTIRWAGFSALLLTGVSREHAAGRLAALRELAARSKHLPASAGGVGAAHFPGDGETAEGLIARAERRMHADKRQPQSLPALVVA